MIDMIGLGWMEFPDNKCLRTHDGASDSAYKDNPKKNSHSPLTFAICPTHTCRTES